MQFGVLQRLMANFVQEAKDKFYYVYSCEVDIPFKIKM